MLVFNSLLNTLKDDTIFKNDVKITKEIGNWIDSLKNAKNNKPFQRLKMFIQQLIIKYKV